MTEAYKAGLSVSEIQKLTNGQLVAKLSSNENPFGPSPKAVRAASEELNSVNFYPERTDQKLCEKLAQFHGRKLMADNFFGANSGVEALSLIEDALLSSGSEAVILPPCFGAYTPSVKAKDGKIIEVPLVGNDFKVDVNGMFAAMTEKTKLVYLCNPNNPTGTFFGANILNRILDDLPEHVTLIYDEVYYQFATEFDLPDAIKHVLDGRNIVIVHSFSKAYGLAGLRVGYGIAKPEIVKKIKAKKRSFHINSVSMAAAIAAIDDEQHLKITVENNTVERKKVSNRLKQCGFEVSSSQANFVMFKCPDGYTAEAFTKEMLHMGVMVRPAFFLPNHIRVTIGKPNENESFLKAVSTKFNNGLLK